MKFKRLSENNLAVVSDFLKDNGYKLQCYYTVSLKP